MSLTWKLPGFMKLLLPTVVWMGPTDDPKISSPYGKRGLSIHRGVDVVDQFNANATLIAPFSTLVTRGYDGASGNYVLMALPWGHLSYAHMEEVDEHIPRGKFVYIAAGGRLGKIGTTGRSTGPHVHITLKINGKRYDASEFYPKLRSSE
jgi:murein DD-endopeptidase MepM/ murein hydrolase activator NlpD